MRVAAAGAVGLSQLDPYLRPAPIVGEVLRFDLSTYRSTVTREMLQIRLRMTPAAFAAGDGLVAANVAGDALEVDAGGLEAANAAVRRRLASGLEWPVRYLRRLHDGAAAVDRQARGFGWRLARGVRPAPEHIGAYVLDVAHYQALGALKFCLPSTLRARLLHALDEPDMVDALLAADGPTLWSDMRAREAALALLRRRGPDDRYRRQLERYRHEFGYLYAEDVDFREHETLEALDRRMGAVTDGRRSLSQALAADQDRKRKARRRFAEAAPDATLISHVLLARALAEHEDLNRRAKMRFLRDLRDLADLTGLDIERDGLEAFTAAGEPVLPSS